MHDRARPPPRLELGNVRSGPPPPGRLSSPLGVLTVAVITWIEETDTVGNAPSASSHP